MISLAEARRIIAEKVEVLPSEASALAQVHGRVLRQSVVATEDYPAFNRSAMDGYAIRANDPSTRFEVVGEVVPGQSPALSLGPGQCARIFTGAQLPEGADQVLKQEDVIREGSAIVVATRSRALHVRLRGEDAAAGTRLMEPGIRIGAAEMALLAQIGEVEPVVSKAPRVLHLATGEELVAPELLPIGGQIRDSNSSLVASLLKESGAELVGHRRCGDAVTQLVEAVQLARDFDLLLISGGASVGDYDFGRRALEELGFGIHFHGVALRPGKPLLFASRGAQVAFVIPGNPVSHFVVYQTAIRAALERMEGAAASWPLAEIELAVDMTGAADPRETYWPAHVFCREGRLLVKPLGWRSSGDLCGMVSANALVQQLPGAGGRQQGESIKCLLLPGW